MNPTTAADALDPQVRALLDGTLAPPPGPPAPFEPAAMRANLDDAAPLLAGPPEPVDDVVEARAGDVPLRIYRPRDAHGVVVLLHGGGWVIGSLDSHDQLARKTANAAGATVVSVGYRLAPEHPFPAAVDDAHAAMAYVRDAFPGAPIAVMGDSAGGNLAAVLARHHRDVRLQALVYPVCDARTDTPSYAAHGRGYPLTTEAMAWFLQQYGGDPSDPDLAPARAADLRGLPPALVLLASHDVLRSEGEDYAERLRAAGVPTTLSVYPGTIHGFVRWFADVDQARAAVAELGAALQAALA